MSRLQGPVLGGEAAASDGAVGVEGHPHGAAVGVHRGWSHAPAEPARTVEESGTTGLQRHLATGPR